MLASSMFDDEQFLTNMNPLRKASPARAKPSPAGLECMLPRDPSKSSVFACECGLSAGDAGSGNGIVTPLTSSPTCSDKTPKTASTAASPHIATRSRSLDSSLSSGSDRGSSAASAVGRESRRAGRTGSVSCEQGSASLSGVDSCNDSERAAQASLSSQCAIGPSAASLARRSASPASDQWLLLQREATDLCEWLCTVRGEMPAPSPRTQAAVPTPRLVPSPKWAERCHSRPGRTPERSEKAVPRRALSVFEEDILCCPMDDPAEAFHRRSYQASGARARYGSVQAALRRAERARCQALVASSFAPTRLLDSPVLSPRLGSAAFVAAVTPASQVFNNEYGSGLLSGSRSRCPSSGSQRSCSLVGTRALSTPRSESSTSSFEAWRAALRVRIEENAGVR